MSSFESETWGQSRRYPFDAADDEAFDESETAWLIAPLPDEFKVLIRNSEAWNELNIPVYQKPIFKGLDVVINQVSTGEEECLDLTDSKLENTSPNQPTAA